MKKTILFDLDGTLLDTLGDLAAAVNSALSGFSFPTRSVDEVRSFIGNGVPTLIHRALPAGTDDETHARAVASFTEYYLKHMCDNTVPYDGIPELLEMLRENGCRIGVVSNKKNEATTLICKKLLGGLYDVAIGASNDGERKPRPDMIFSALKALSSTPDEAVFIGDSDIDTAAAKNAGVDCISVLWGYRDGEFLKAHGSEIFAKTPHELGQMILTLQQ